MPTREVILAKLHSLLTQIDAEGSLRVEVASTQSKKSVILEDVGHGLPGQKTLVRYSKPTNKMLVNNITYFAKFVIVIEYILQHIGISEHVKFRQVGYAKSLSMSQPNLKNLVNNIAVTAGLHPWSLGLEPETDGKVYLNPTTTINLWIVDTLFKFAAKTQSAGFQNALGSIRPRAISDTEPIPTRIMQLKVTKGLFTLRAVVVIEHKNIGLAAHWVQENLENVIIIITQGYPSVAAREFMCLLYLELKALPIQWLYYSDHDVQGAQIFTVLKSGALATAYSSIQLTCPKLEWAGPTVKELMAHHEAAFEPDSQDTNARTEHLKGIEAQIIAEPTRSDHSLLKGMHSTGILNDQPNLASELDIIIKGKGKFHLALLSDGIPMGMEKFIIEDVNRRTSVTTTNQPNPAQNRPSTLRDFDAIETQSPMSLRNLSSSIPPTSNPLTSNPLNNNPTTSNPTTSDPITSNPLDCDPPQNPTEDSQDANVVDSAKAKKIFKAARFETRVLELGPKGQN